MSVETAGSGGTFTDVVDWEANHLGTRTLTEDETVQIIGEQNVRLILSGYTPDGFNTIIEPIAGEGLKGFSATDALTYNAAKGGAIINTANNVGIHTCTIGINGTVILRDIQIRKAANNGAAFGTTNDNTVVDMQRCIVRGGQFAGSVMFGTNTSTMVFKNCLIEMVGDGNNVRVLNANGGGVKRFVNCTFINTTGDHATPPLRIALGSTVLDYAQCLILGWRDAHTFASGNLQGNYNIIDDIGATIQGANSIDTAVANDEIRTLWTDMRLEETGSNSENFTPAASADVDTPSDDIIGQTRTGDVDCGCWALEAAGFSGSLAATLAGIAAAGTGALEFAGTAAPQVSGVTLSASGAAQQLVDMTGALTLGNIAVSGAGAQEYIASASLSIAGVTVNAAGIVVQDGAGALTLSGIALSAQGALELEGPAAITLSGIDLNTSAAVAFQGTGQFALSGISVDAAGALAFDGAVQIGLSGVSVDSTGLALPDVLAQGAIALSGIQIQAVGKGGTFFVSFIAEIPLEGPISVFGEDSDIVIAVSDELSIQS